MNPTRAAGALALAAIALACTAAGSGSPRLELSGPSWVFDGFDARLEIASSGALAENDLSVVVAAGSKVVGRVEVPRGRTVGFEVPSAALAPGANRISVKSGTERTELTVRVLPLVYLAAPAAALLTVGIAVFARRRRRSASG